MSKPQCHVRACRTILRPSHGRYPQGTEPCGQRHRSGRMLPGTRLLGPRSIRVSRHATLTLSMPSESRSHCQRNESLSSAARASMFTGPLVRIPASLAGASLVHVRDQCIALPPDAVNPLGTRSLPRVRVRGQQSTQPCGFEASCKDIVRMSSQGPIRAPRMSSRWYGMCPFAESRSGRKPMHGRPLEPVHCLGFSFELPDLDVAVAIGPCVCTCTGIYRLWRGVRIRTVDRRAYACTAAEGLLHVLT